MIRLFVLVMGQEMVWVLVLDDELVDVVVVADTETAAIVDAVMTITDARKTPEGNTLHLIFSA